MDIDVSLGDDFEDLAETQNRIFGALTKKFESANHAVIDLCFDRRPDESASALAANWGGYEIRFKVIPVSLYRSLANDGAKASRQADEVGPNHERTFHIQISKGEYCSAKQDVQFAEHAIPVYTPPMIAIEKLRAICQQMPEYQFRRHPTARARDFYDIHAIVAGMGIDLGIQGNLGLIRLVFDAKHVPLLLIPQIGNHRDFHRQEWPAVQDAVSGAIEEFDFYFDFVLDQTKRLKTLWAV